MNSDQSRDGTTGTEIFLPSANQLIGKCRVLHFIASGGIASVFKVFHEELEVVRAIKLLKPGYTEETRERFTTEAKVSAHLHHPNIIHIYNVGTWQNKLPYIEMEYVDGTTLQDILKERSKLPALIVIGISQIVCSALEYAQNQDFTLYTKKYHGLVHRDIKPANILVSKEGVVKLADFGIALPGCVSLHTQGPYTMGTYAYLSPEQLTGKQADIRCDIYAVGAVMYEMLTGQRLFPHSLVSELVNNKLNGSFTPLRTLAPKTPRLLENIVEKCLSTSPEDRYQSMSQLLKELKEALNTMTTSSPSSLVASYLLNRDTPPKAPKHLSKRSKTKKNACQPKTHTMLAGTIVIATVITFVLIRLYFGFFFRPKSVNPSHSSDNRQASIATDTVYQKDKNDEQTNRAPKQKTAPLSKNRSSGSEENLAQKATSQNGHNKIFAFDKAVQAYEQYRYADAITAFKKVDTENLHDSLSVKRRLYLISCYLKTNQTDEAMRLVQLENVEDGFFYLLKARLLHQEGSFDQTTEMLQKALTTPTKFGNIREESMLLWARNHDAVYSKKANLDNKKKALRAWKLASRTLCTDMTTAACEEAKQRIVELEQ